MSHFLCPSSTTPHYIFGPPTSFRQTCAELDLPILAEIPIEAAVSARGDGGSPVVMDTSAASSTAEDVATYEAGVAPAREDGQGKEATSASGRGSGSGEGSARAAFSRLAKAVWAQL